MQIALQTLNAIVAFMTPYREPFMNAAIFVASASWTYILWVALHFCAAQTYVKYCVGSTWTDMFLSIFYVSTPFCQGVSWVLYHGAHHIYWMWFVLGTYVSQQMMNMLFTPIRHKDK